MTQKNLKLKGFYSTSDLAMATAISLWFPIDEIDRQDPRKASFRFKRDEKFDKLLEAYWKRELKIEPQEYFNQLKAIKARLYAND